MGKQIWKPGNMLYPLPAVMVSTADTKGADNIITVAWTGTVCTDPAMLYISVRPERYSYPYNAVSCVIRVDLKVYFESLRLSKYGWPCGHCPYAWLRDDSLLSNLPHSGTSCALCR